MFLPRKSVGAIKKRRQRNLRCDLNETIKTYLEEDLCSVQENEKNQSLRKPYS